MPPPEAKIKLTEDQKKLLTEWIKSGAKYDEHWAFIKAEKPSVPIIMITKSEEEWLSNNNLYAR